MTAEAACRTLAGKLQQLFCHVSSKAVIPSLVGRHNGRQQPPRGGQARTFHSFDANEPRQSRLLLRNTHSDLLSSVFGSADGKLLRQHPVATQIKHSSERKVAGMTPLCRCPADRGLPDSSADRLAEHGQLFAHTGMADGTSRFRVSQALLAAHASVRTHLGT